MPTLPATPITLLAAIDYSETASLVVQHILAMARQTRAAEVHFLHVHALHAMPTLRDAEQRAADEREARRAELQAWLSARLQDPDGSLASMRFVAHEAGGNPAEVIVEMANDLLASVVIVGTHGRKGMQRMVMGSVSEAVVRNAGCPVFVVRPQQHHQAVPAIEPPCPRCVEARIQSHGEVYWCEQHSEKHGRRHTYYNTRLSTWVNQRISL
jgi:nucleotide-binding universal stress UspA family protein